MNESFSGVDPGDASQVPTQTETCAECSKPLTATDRVAAGDRVFCGVCHENLRLEIEHAVAAMSTDIPYHAAILGAVLGGTIGVLVWWGFTVLTKIAFGLVAVAIGFLVGLGAVRFAGGKRSGGLQAVSVVVAVLSYAVATYLVNRTFINRELAQRGEGFRIGFPPETFALFVNVVSASFGIMDVVFLAIIVYEAWKIPKPLRLPPGTIA